MSVQHPTHVERAGVETDSNEHPSPGEFLALLDAEYTQDLLTAVQAEAKSARALAEECGASRPTVYRRLNRLDDAGLVESSMAYDADGHHRTVFEATLDRFVVELDDDGLSLCVRSDASG